MDFFRAMSKFKKERKKFHTTFHSLGYAVSSFLQWLFVYASIKVMTVEEADDFNNAPSLLKSSY